MKQRKEHQTITAKCKLTLCGFFNAGRSYSGLNHLIKDDDNWLKPQQYYTSQGQISDPKPYGVLLDSLPFVYTRSKDNQKIMVALNPSAKEVSVDLPQEQLVCLPDVLDAPETAGIAKCDGGWRLTLGPVSGAMYKVI